MCWVKTPVENRLSAFVKQRHAVENDIYEKQMRYRKLRDSLTKHLKQQNGMPDESC